jgi:hypothetical protein
MPSVKKLPKRRNSAQSGHPVYIHCRTISSAFSSGQGCQMVCFQTRQPNLEKNSGPHIGKCLYLFYGYLEYFMDIWDILWPFGTFCVHLVHFSGFGMTHKEKSGNPGSGFQVGVSGKGFHGFPHTHMCWKVYLHEALILNSSQSAFMPLDLCNVCCSLISMLHISLTYSCILVFCFEVYEVSMFLVQLQIHLLNWNSRVRSLLHED